MVKLFQGLLTFDFIYFNHSFAWCADTVTGNVAYSPSDCEGFVYSQ